MRRRLSSRAYDPHDEWLDSLGLYRKPVARDGSCLFRAVAEQVFMTQTEHVRVRNLCLQYMVLHKDDFQPFLEVPLDHHVFSLQDVREWGGHLEIIAMSRLFNINFIIYRNIGEEPYKATDVEGKTLMLLFSSGNHYDIVYKKDDAASRGFCQSVIYDILYSHVFKLKDVRLAVDTMLHDKEYANLRRDSANSAELKEIGALVEKILGTNTSTDSHSDEKITSPEEKLNVDDIHADDVRGLLAHGIPPFPYKVAKSLDPDIYRNIEYDTWNTVRREVRFGPFDSNGYQAGVKVMIKLELLPNRTEVESLRKAGTGEANESERADEKIDVYHGHIQEMSENKGPVDVYIEEIGSRLKVPYESLEKVPPTPPRSPWHGQLQQQQLHGSSGYSYKKLSGYYQKAPLPPENEFSGGKGKKKGAKQQREGVPLSSSAKYGGATQSSVGQSPRSRAPQGIHQLPNYKFSNSRGISYGSNRSAVSPAREDFPSFSSNSGIPGEVEGVWAVKPYTNQPLVSSTPKSNSGSYFPTSPQATAEVDETKLQIQAVTEALHQVMSVGGQEVRVTGQQLEVINNIGSVCIGDQPFPHLEENTKVDGEVSTTVSLNNGGYPVSKSDHNCSAPNEPESFECQQRMDSVAQPPHSQSDLEVIFMTPPPVAQSGDSSSPTNAAVYSVPFPAPYPTPSYVQMMTSVTPGDGSLTPSQFTPPPTSADARPNSGDGNSEGTDSDPAKINPGMASVLIYQVPVPYGGYGYGYNQPMAYVPVLPSTNPEEGRPSPVPGTEIYQPMVPYSGWLPGYMGEVMSSPAHPVPPQNVIPYHREHHLSQYPPPSPFPEPPPFHHHRGRGRGGGQYHYNHQSRGHHYNAFPCNPNGGMSQSGSQRPLPPRFHKGGSPMPGRGGTRHHSHHAKTVPPPPPSYQRNLQYEGQPLMHMGSRKSSSDSLSSQVVSGGKASAGGLASPPLPYAEPESPQGVIPLGAHDGPPLHPHDPMAYYSTPPGYVMSGPWMWKMM